VGERIISGAVGPSRQTARKSTDGNARVKRLHVIAAWVDRPHVAAMERSLSAMTTFVTVAIAHKANDFAVP
jgi:hypothetical protein